MGFPKWLAKGIAWLIRHPDVVKAGVDLAKAAKK